MVTNPKIRPSPARSTSMRAIGIPGAVECLLAL
jgi:hypothetical protein